MPIYEYICRDCGIEFETMTTMAKADDVECKACKGKKTERKFSVFGVSSSDTKTGCGTPAPPPACSSGACSGCPGMMG